MDHLDKWGAYRHSFLAVHEEATNLGLRGGGKDVLHDGGDGEDGPVRFGRRGWRFCGVYRLVTEEEVAADMAAIP